MGVVLKSKVLSTSLEDLAGPDVHPSGESTFPAYGRSKVKPFFAQGDQCPVDCPSRSRLP